KKREGALRGRGVGKWASGDCCATGTESRGWRGRAGNSFKLRIHLDELEAKLVQCEHWASRACGRLRLYQPCDRKSCEGLPRVVNAVQQLLMCEATPQRKRHL